MKVKDLINELSKFDGDMEVVAKSDNYELKHSEVQVRGVYEGNRKLVRESFMDDFDGNVYSTEVYKYCKDGEGEKVLIISS